MNQLKTFIFIFLLFPLINISYASATDAIFNKIGIPEEHRASRTVSKVNVDGYESILDLPSNSEVILPDVADNHLPVSFIVNSELTLSINQKYLNISEDAYKELKVFWDFGDGESINAGPSIKHTYKKVGSYLVKIQVYDSTTVFDANKTFPGSLSYFAILQINVVDSHTYKLPESILLAMPNPLLPKNGMQQFVFDNSHSFGSTPLKYDLSENSKLLNTFPFSIKSFFENEKIVVLNLRVTDQNNFFSDEKIDIYPVPKKVLMLFKPYYQHIYSSFEETLNQTYNNFLKSELSRFRMAITVFNIGALQIFLNPFIGLFTLFYGSKRYGFKLRDYLEFCYTFTIIHLFITVVLVLTFLFMPKGYNLAHTFAQMLSYLSLFTIFLFLVRLILKKGSSPLEKSEFVTIGLALGIMPRPFSYSSFLLNTFFLDIFDSFYLLVVFTLGGLFSYFIAISLGNFFQKLFSKV